MGKAPKMYNEWNNKVKIPEFSGIENEYQREKNKDTNCWELRKIGTRNIYAEIQETINEVLTIKEIIKQYENNERDWDKDWENLNFGDTREIPNNKIETYNMINKKIDDQEKTKTKIQELKENGTAEPKNGTTEPKNETTEPKNETEKGK